jgi:CDP-glucose 4,6-dehydratase
MDFKRHFEGKRVFLTGHTGFKGAWLLMMLKELGAEVMGYSLAPKNPDDLYFKIDGDGLCLSQIADIRDAAKLEQAILGFEPDFVFHLAAQALVIDGYNDPVGTYESNVMGTINLIQALRKLEKPCYAVLITTDKVYENFETGEAYAEDAKLGGYDPYSSSKACAEIAIASFRNSFLHPKDFNVHKKSIASVRSGNVIGGGDWSANRLVPDIAKSLIANQTITIRNPEATRPWQHVLDPLTGYLTLAVKMTEDPIRYATAFNFGPEPEDERDVRSMTELAIKIWGSGMYETPEIKDKPHEAGKLNLAIDNAKTELGWAPRFTSADAVNWTMKWYQEGRNDAFKYTLMQIKTYLKYQ